MAESYSSGDSDSAWDEENEEDEEDHKQVGIILRVTFAEALHDNTIPCPSTASRIAQGKADIHD